MIYLLLLLLFAVFVMDFAKEIEIETNKNDDFFWMQNRINENKQKHLIWFSFIWFVNIFTNHAEIILLNISILSQYFIKYLNDNFIYIFVGL